MGTLNIHDSWAWEGLEEQENTDVDAHFDFSTAEDDGLALTHEERDVLELARMEASDSGYFGEYDELCRAIRSSRISAPVPDLAAVASVLADAHKAVTDWQPMAPRYRHADTYNPARRRAAGEPGRWPAAEMDFLHGRGPRTEGRNHEPTLRDLEAMREKYGLSVLLTLMQPHMDSVSLFAAEGRTSIVCDSKANFGAWLSVKGKKCEALTASLHRGGLWGVTHTHGVTHLSGLSQSVQATLRAASRGPGGGVLLTSGASGLPMVHGVIIEDGAADLERVAKYLCQFPDGAARLPVEDDRHMDMLEEMAQAEKNAVNLVYRMNSRWRPGKSL